MTVLSALLVVVALASGVPAQDIRGGGRGDGRDDVRDGSQDGPGHSTRRPSSPGTRFPSHHHRHHDHRFSPCCVAYFPPEPAPLPPLSPPVVVVTPSPPTLVYVPTPRVEPAPEIQGENGRWERHGNGKEYPYTWVWVPAGRR